MKVPMVHILNRPTSSIRRALVLQTKGTWSIAKVGHHPHRPAPPPWEGASKGRDGSSGERPTVERLPEGMQWALLKEGCQSGNGPALNTGDGHGHESSNLSPSSIVMQTGNAPAQGYPERARTLGPLHQT